MRGRPAGFGAHAPMRSEEIFDAAADDVGESVTEVQHGLAIDRLNAVVGKTQAANDKRPELSSRREERGVKKANTKRLGENEIGALLFFVQDGGDEFIAAKHFDIVHEGNHGVIIEVM
jgi:hypothetical protein